ncbi:MAG: response regulator transcription factor [Syntrophorhabdaceae bacterium]|nr:response regulator transcription factor [Syntrophorhabdaceae bacterium]MDD4197221.1 response regulator transcription factor [Syntrophorhabdaceae bacterium]
MKTTILLADDHPVVRDGLQMLLEAQRDMKVVASVGTGKDAVREALRLRPDVVVMDIVMPELNGIDATARIMEKLPSTHVVILSMYASPEYIYRAFHAGACGYVFKESAGSEVTAAIRAAREGRRYMSEEASDAVMEGFMQVGSFLNTESPFARLSRREREVLQLLVEGKTGTEIAREVFLSPKTVDTYRRRIMTKLGVKGMPALIRFAIQNGLTGTD